MTASAPKLTRIQKLINATKEENWLKRKRSATGTPHQQKRVRRIPAESMRDYLHQNRKTQLRPASLLLLRRRSPQAMNHKKVFLGIAILSVVLIAVAVNRTPQKITPNKLIGFGLQM